MMPLTAQKLKTLFFFLLWFALNALFNVYNKRVLNVVSLPWIVTFVQLAVGLVLVGPLWAFKIRELPRVRLDVDWRWLLPVGLFHALSSIGGVSAISSGMVSTFQVLKALEPISAAGLAVVVYQQVFAWPVYASILVVIYGVVYACWKGDMEVSVTMFTGTMVSMVGASMRSLYCKQKMDLKRLSPANLFAVMNITSLVLLFPFMIFDVPKIPQALRDIQSSGETTGRILLWTILSGFYFYTNNEVAFFALNQVHPVTHAVANIFRRILIILSSILVLGDRLTKQNALGAAIAILGVFLYSLAKHKTKPTKLHCQKPRFHYKFLLSSTVFGLAFWQLRQSLHHDVYPSLQVKNSLALDGHLNSDLIQPVVHYLRVNDMQIQEIVYVFQRADQLRLATSAIEAVATDKVLCFQGIQDKAVEELSRVWTQKLKGRTKTTFHDSDCDAIVTAGGTYMTTASTAFRRSIPVINLWNSDGYYPQAAMLALYELFAAQHQRPYSTDQLVGKTFWHIPTNKNDPRLMAFIEASYKFKADLMHCEDHDCQQDAVHLDTIAGPIVSDSATALLAAVAELALAKAGKLPHSFQFPGIRCEPGIIVSGKVNSHDPHFVYANAGSILFALQWERVTKMKFGMEPLTMQALGFNEVASVAQAYAKEEFHVSEIDLALVVRSSKCRDYGPNMSKIQRGKETCSGVKQLSEWLPNVPILYIEHLLTHATYGFFDSPFESALVVAMHGAGSELYLCAVYLARRGFQPILLKLCGDGYNDMGRLYALNGGRYDEVATKEKFEKKTARDVLEYSGVFMGYSALGKPLPCLDRVARMIEGNSSHWSALELIEEECKESWRGKVDASASTKNFPRYLPVEIQRDVARTFEELWEMSYLHHLDDVKHELESVDGIVLSGGSALNVKAAQRFWDTFEKPVWIPSAPSDEGMGVGATWTVCQPPRASVPLQYHGLPLLDRASLPRIAKQWGSSCEYLGFDDAAARRLATLLAVDKMIIAMVIGNQEYGPRALSHRSLMAYPDSIAIRDRMNALKFRQFYRPTCPTVAEEFVEEMFIRPENIRSPFMSFAPQLQDWVGEELPAVRHFDNTARPQTLSQSTEPFVHKMLHSIPKVLSKGKPVVINTSFNIKGQPIINTVEDSLYMLCDRPQLDFLFVEGYLFSLPGNGTHPACATKKR